MTAPTLTASLDASTYKPGDKMTLTVSYTDPDTKAVEVTVTVTDASGNTSSPASVSAVIDPTTLKVTDASGRVWAKVSDTGKVAVFTATA